jgi:alginate O-acetyltransferase complex protein AlgI
MLFCSAEFVVFFAVLLAVYWAMPWRRGRVWLLLAASFFFYARWNKWLAILICVSTLLDYLLALGMDRLQRPLRRKLLLSVSLLANLGLLGYFKYANFFLASFYDAFGWAHDSSRPLLDILLPVGISFYTFEAINYTVDVYRRRIRAERNLADLMLFILFFPHLVAGPIVRARDFLQQIKRSKRWGWARLHLGAQFFLMGLFKKLAIADRMAMYVDPVFADPGRYSCHVAWLALLAYAVQIYCDFSGYSDMAVGCAHMLGYRLARNFDMPYIAPNITEFWNRWHMSLGSWLRDYVFIPLGGSRGGEWQTRRNLVTTFALCGLWHGANWTFVVWGGVQGLLLVLHRAFRLWCTNRPALVQHLGTAAGTAARVALTLLCFCLSLVLFRMNSLHAAGSMFLRLVYSPAPALSGPLTSLGILLPLAVVAACHLLGRRAVWQRWQARAPAPVLGLSYAGVLVLSLVLSPAGTKPFIYFQF